MGRDFLIFHASANQNLASRVAQYLGVELGRALVSRFSDGEIHIEIEENVRGREIFVLQSTCYPSNETLMELILMGDALRRASAASITAIIPYFGYARQDRRVRSSRVPISAKVVADMLQSVGFCRLITVDLHADQIQGFFYIPVDNVYAGRILLDSDTFSTQHSDLLIVSPDVGGVVRARAIAKLLNVRELAIIDKRRSGPNQTEVMNLIGRAKGRHCLIVDDIVDTAGTLCQAAETLKNHGADRVSAYCVHPVLSGDAILRIERSVLDRVVVTDSIPLATHSSHIQTVSLDRLLSKTIQCVLLKQSVRSMLFQDQIE